MTGWYVAIERGKAKRFLLGPYGTKAEARGKMDEAWAIAVGFDESHAGDTIGVWEVTMPPGRPLPLGWFGR